MFFHSPNSSCRTWSTAALETENFHHHPLLHSHSDLSADDDVYVSDNDDDLASNEGLEPGPPKPKMDKDLTDIGERSEDKVNNNGTNALPTQVN